MIQQFLNLHSHFRLTNHFARLVYLNPKSYSLELTKVIADFSHE